MGGDIAGASPWLCLVTDRRRLTRAVGVRDEEWWALLHAQVVGAIHAHITFVQIRERDLEARVLFELTRALAREARGSATRVLVNDRVDVALAAGADGVQLRGDSPPPSRVRSLAPAPFMLGRSVHDVHETEQAHGADFLIAGTMFRTVSKADKQECLGVSGIATIVRASRGVPVLAIGGIGEQNAPQVAASGARGLASIGAFLPAGPGEDIQQFVRERADKLRSAFHTGVIRDL